jgi:mannose-6-phosphate isomerase
MSDIRRVEKGWGYELIFADKPAYCGKILHFNTGEKSSMHFHANKEETFYVVSGEYNINTINTQDATQRIVKLTFGQKIDIPRFRPHQIESIVGGNIIEVSTHDDVNDSYRVDQGSSQRNNRTGHTIPTEESQHWQSIPECNCQTSECSIMPDVIQLQNLFEQ